MNWKKTIIPLSAAAMLLLAACNAEEEVKEDQKVEETQAKEQEQKQHEQIMTGTRHIVTYDKGLLILDEKFQLVKQFETGGVAAVLGSDARHAFLRDSENKDSYTLLDIGIWQEDHGDHPHAYSEEPVLADFDIAAQKPSHIVSINEQTAVFHDGNGLVEVYDSSTLSTKEQPKPLYSYQGKAHHGVAVPLADGTLATTYATTDGEALPDSVKIVNQTGEEVATIVEGCEGLHGTIYTADKLAFGCIGSIATYDVQRKESANIALPTKEARVSTINQHADSTYYLTNYREGENPQTKVGIVNSATNAFQLVELPAAYSAALVVAPNDIGYVLAENGTLYQIDLVTATIVAEIKALEAFNLEEEKVTLGLAVEDLFIVVPSKKAIYQLHGDQVHAVAELNVAPTSIVTLKAF